MIILARIFQIAMIFIGTASFLTACTISTPYQPIDGGQGYSEQQIGENRFRVMFKGNSSTSKKTAEDHLLFRAAELTLEQEYDYFIVVKQETEKTSSSRAATPLRYSYYPCSAQRFPYYAYGFSWAFYTSSSEKIRRYEAIAFIVMGKGDKPEDNPGAFDAREVIADLGAFF